MLVDAYWERPEIGDYCTVHDNDLTWKLIDVLHFQSVNGPLAVLESGQTGRRRYEPLDNLRMFRKGDR